MQEIRFPERPTAKPDPAKRRREASSDFEEVLIQSGGAPNLDQASVSSPPPKENADLRPGDTTGFPTRAPTPAQTNDIKSSPERPPRSESRSGQVRESLEDPIRGTREAPLESRKASPESGSRNLPETPSVDGKAQTDPAAPKGHPIPAEDDRVLQPTSGEPPPSSDDEPKSEVDPTAEASLKVENPARTDAVDRGASEEPSLPGESTANGERHLDDGRSPRDGRSSHPERQPGDPENAPPFKDTESSSVSESSEREPNLRATQSPETSASSPAAKATSNPAAESLGSLNEGAPPPRAEGEFHPTNPPAPEAIPGSSDASAARTDPPPPSTENLGGRSPAPPANYSSREVASQVLIRVDPSQQEARLLLHPQELGQVKVLLQVSESGVIAKILAETPAAQAALAEQSNHLVRGLEGKGLNVSSVEIDVDPDAGTRDRGDPTSSRNDEETPETDSTTRNPQGSDSPLEPEPRNRIDLAGGSSLSLIDLQI